MKMRGILLCLAFLLTGSWGFDLPKNLSRENAEKTWAILVAGSNGWNNYRHQADVCHAYHLLRLLGVPAGQIITFLYDDIAYNPQNPFKGKIYNGYDHVDWYIGTKIDYKGPEIGPENLERVMLGDPNLKALGRKVLGSGPDDYVFFYYADHGGPGILALPEGSLYANHFNKILRTMHKKRMYKEMVLYIEACYSGSMFEMTPPTGINVYAMTAANSQESSYATFCEDRDIPTCLSDEFTNNWMVDTEQSLPRKRTLTEQYVAVRSQTLKSHVCRYGDGTIGNEVIGKFQGYGTSMVRPDVVQTGNGHSVPAAHAHMTALLRGVALAKTDEDRKFAERKLNRAIQLAKLMDEVFEDISADVAKRLNTIHDDVSPEHRMECFQTVFETFQTHCFKMQQVPEVVKHLNKLHDMCQAGYDPAHLVQSVLHVCT